MRFGVFAGHTEIPTQVGRDWETIARPRRMKPHLIAFNGKITSDGRLSIQMGELKDFCKKWPNCRVVGEIRIYEPKTSEALKGYYYHCVVRKARQALWESGERKTDEETEHWLREMSPLMYEQNYHEDLGKYITRLRKIEELDNAELIAHIDTIKQLMAENFSIIIDDPISIL